MVRGVIPVVVFPANPDPVMELTASTSALIVVVPAPSTVLLALMVWLHWRVVSVKRRSLAACRATSRQVRGGACGDECYLEGSAGLTL